MQHIKKPVAEVVSGMTMTSSGDVSRAAGEGDEPEGANTAGSGVPVAKAAKYDRQLRLWGDHGQKCLEQAKVR